MNLNNKNVGCNLIIFSDLHYAPEKPIGTGSKVERKLMHYAEPIINRLISIINNKTCPDVVINLGDCIQDFNNHDKDIKNLTYIWNVFQNIKYPFYSIAGNHDLHSMTREEVEKIMGYKHSTFSKDIKGYHFVFLGQNVKKQVNCLDGGISRTNQISNEDLLWLDNDLQKNTLPVIVLTHYGVAEDNMKGNWWFEENFEDGLLENRMQLKEILKKCKELLAVFSGHQHWTKKVIEDGISYYLVGSLTENINNDGIPDGVYLEVKISEKNVEILEKHVKL